MTATHLTATEATGLFESGELSPVELLTDMIARVKRVEPTINAVTEEMIDSAYEADRKSVV